MRKTRTDVADVTWRCSSPQTRAAATGNSRSPTVDSRVRRTIGNDDDAEPRTHRSSGSDDRRKSSARYDDAEYQNIEFVLLLL